MFTSNTIANSSYIGVYILNSSYNIFSSKTIANSNSYGIRLRYTLIIVLWKTS
ncbi:MAG: hypothetical protein K9W45_02150 [Candidatus Heimdallarchaeum aukensis]|uniref:Right handed beta helix domain-containing protein n=1 Tax=Candidatus Heimdallarchaeum aukensis TaxID=2876573 RepID=A0A9Y1FM00_9ARCH|nr:MAG: hypothetical protein K9W45_02150 [Candidatus Heimdallarchaeum aukensis]